MTNDELLARIYKELNGEYQIGFHHSTVESYVIKSRFDPEKYCMDPDDVSENDIISSILSKGLYVPEKCIGLDCTVRFPKDVDASSFNYKYAGGCGKKYILVIIIPNYIYLGGKEYFIGDMTQPISLANYSFFHTLLPKEFIYGYYIRDVRYKDDIERDFYFYDDYIFEDEFDFYPNENFYGYMSKEEQEQFWLNYFKNNKLRISILDAVNYPNIFNVLFHNSRNRYAIKCSRKQLMIRKRKINNIH